MRILPHPRDAKTGRFRRVLDSERQVDAMLEDLIFLKESGEHGPAAVERLRKMGRITSKPHSVRDILSRKGYSHLWDWMVDKQETNDYDLRDKLREYKLESRYKHPERLI